MNRDPSGTALPVGTAGFRPACGFLIIGLGALVVLLTMLWLHPTWLAGPTDEVPRTTLWQALVAGVAGPLIFGGAYHLLPVLAGVPLWSARLPWVHLALHLAGLAWVTAGLAGLDGADGPVGGWLVFAGVIVFVVNQQVTATRLSLWEPANIMFSTAQFWLVVSGALAVVPGAARLLPLAGGDAGVLTGVQVIIGIHGVALQALLAAALKALPMFLVTRPRLVPLAWAGWFSLNAGLLLLVADVSSQAGVFGGPAAWLITAGVTASLLAALASGRGGWRHAGFGLGLSILGLVLILPLLALALGDLSGAAGADAAAWLREHGLLLLGGPVLFAGLGFASRAVPLLFWQWRYAGRAGREPVPHVSEMSLPGALPPLALALLLGWGYLAAGMWLGEATGIVLAAACYLSATLLMIVHLTPAFLTLLHPDLTGIKAGRARR